MPLVLVQSFTCATPTDVRLVYTQATHHVVVNVNVFADLGAGQSELR